MMDSDKQNANVELGEGEMPISSVEDTRRKLMTKLAAGAFAFPAVLASISAQAAPGSGPIPD